MASKINYKIYKKYSLFIYLAAVALTLLVFTPIGFEHGGAKRWIHLGTLSFQPSEFLKIGFIIILSAWIATAKEKFRGFKFGFLPFLILSLITGVILLTQPDTDTFLIILSAGLAIFIVGGGRWRYLFVSFAICIVGLTFLALTTPYIMNRVNTYMNPSQNALGSGWQIQQSLIAVGSGGFSGRGFGQSIQKFNVLPEPIGDSIFAVASEEFGFIGSTTIILLFLFFALRGLKIAHKTQDIFGRLMVVGIVIMITSQAFVNIGAMLGLIPLSGITLPFVSHGGTALFMTLLEVGIILNISKNSKK
jgi:cell division protein FtsW